MMDWGLKNIEDHLYRNRALLAKAGNDYFLPEPTIAVDYDWEENRIRISIGLRTTELSPKTIHGLSEVRSRVEWVVQYVRASLSLRPIEAFFRHRGFRNKASPGEPEAELAGLTELVVTVRDADGHILSRCKAPLNGTDLIWLTIGDL